jgi:23S rRNA (guanine2445-N2)-methyltransferase
MAEETFFVTAARGLEELVAAELRELGIASLVVEKGGVTFHGDLTDCYRANLWLRTASRVLRRLAEFTCQTPEELYAGVREIPWERYLTADQTLAVDCTLRDSPLTHSRYAALKTKDAVVDRLRDLTGRRPSVDPRSPDLRLNVHLAGTRCSVSLDSSGDPLDRRGYRLDRNEAPLRETLAAALVALSGWDGTVPFYDPFCGSGTIVIEAAMRAACMAPGLLRDRFGFQRWPDFLPAVWEGQLAEARARALPGLPVAITGFDSSAEAVAVAMKNCRRAGVDHLVTLYRRDFKEFALTAGAGVLVANPPYGERLGDKEALRPFYRSIGDILKQRCAGSRAFLLCGDLELAKEVGLKASRRIVVWNGPLECRLLCYELYAGGAAATRGGPPQ